MDRNRGFSLIELLVVVLIVGVLAALVIPSYQEHVAKTRRGEAAGALLEGAQALERYFSANGRYVTTVGGNTLPAIFPTQVPANGAAYYTIAAAGNPTATTFTLRATRTGVMASDPCGNLEITHTGARQLNNATRTVAECWRR